MKTFIVSSNNNHSKAKKFLKEKGVKDRNITFSTVEDGLFTVNTVKMSVLMSEFLETFKQ